MTDAAPLGSQRPARGSSIDRGSVKRAILAVLLVAFLAFAAQMSLISRLHLTDVRLPVLLLGLVIASPTIVLLVLAARGRGVPWRWLGFAIAWGLFATAWLAFFFETILANIIEPFAPALEAAWPDVLNTVPAAFFAPLVEEPVKLAGVVIVLQAVRRGGWRLGLGIGAAVGGLTGLAFSLVEVSHHTAELVNNVGYTDLAGVFVIDWNTIWTTIHAQLAQRLFLGGLSNHALFSALAAVGAVLFLRGQRRAAAGWFAASLLAHALMNSIGVTVHNTVFDSVIGGAGTPPLVLVLVAVMLAAGATFLVAESWAAALLLRRLRRPDSVAAPEPVHFAIQGAATRS